MKMISRLIAAILFILFFFFALKNTQEITLRFFLGYERTDPLVLVLLICFVVGTILGVLAMTPIAFRHRREAARCHKAVAVLQQQYQVLQRMQSPSPQPDSVVPKQHLI